ncbi:hypothetical protein RJ639_026340 [Escallonia herrerae]|uniref:Uncharacterized protein n=1 Tax=Escallonia herrerae TaxID=1293975 RepID=A0AA88UX14_9ASTE|nr:hypothetical protein RJ639_026340 [Escallonia herrerae]
MKNPLQPYSAPNKFLQTLIFLALLVLTVIPTKAVGDCTCEDEAEDRDKSQALKYKLVAIAAILVAGAAGVCLPVLGKTIPALRPEKDVFFVIKAFAAGVILATGFIHVLPDAFDNLTCPCLGENPWGKFPFAGFVAMLSSIGTLMVDTFATSYYVKSHFNNKRTPSAVRGNEDEIGVEYGGRVHVHTHATHGHSHGSSLGEADSSSSQLVRHRVISQVLELGIIVHSVIIGISLGASESPKAIRPLVAALTFHQFFEGMGLGGCISQFQSEPNLDCLSTLRIAFRSPQSLTVHSKDADKSPFLSSKSSMRHSSSLVLAVFFSLTTPVGIVIGIGVASIYKDNSTNAMIVEGIFNAASAGILIYMALVDLLAADFMNPRMQGNGKLQLLANLSLLFGAGCMAVLAKWA